MPGGSNKLNKHLEKAQNVKVIPNRAKNNFAAISDFPGFSMFFISVDAFFFVLRFLGFYWSCRSGAAAADLGEHFAICIFGGVQIWGGSMGQHLRFFGISVEGVPRGAPRGDPTGGSLEGGPLGGSLGGSLGVGVQRGVP